MSPDMLTAALEYAQQGWAVLPLHTPTSNGCSCQRGPSCTAVGKHPRTRYGLSDATTDQQQIKAWWGTWPEANIGILTGVESGLVVIDVDDHESGKGSRSLAEIEQSLGEPLVTLTAQTGRGKHLYFAHPDGNVPNSIQKLAQGIDVRADGGYVVAPPSLHANGSRYTWLNAEQELAELAPVIVQEMRRDSPPVQQFVKWQEESVAFEGERNDTLYKLGCALRGKQAMERDTIVSVLLEYNAAKCDPPLDESEVLRVADSVCQHPAERATNKSLSRLDRNPLYWFPFNIRDWFANQNLVLMDDAQTGQYIRLKAWAWDRGGFLPSDMDKLWRLAKAKSKKAFEKGCHLVLAEYEEVDVDGERKLRHPQLAKLYSDTLEIWMMRKEAAEASVASRSAAVIEKAA
jgi:hypothetical protein